MEYVENYHVTYYKSGIICLLFNTTQRCIYFHRYNKHLYLIGPPEGEDESDESFRKRLVEIPEDVLVFPAGDLYLSTELQEKDQILFYFIPFTLLKERQYVNGIHPKGETESQ